MRYISLFSGIEAASVAWQPLGWEAVAFAEIEPFPSCQSFSVAGLRKGLADPRGNLALEYLRAVDGVRLRPPTDVAYRGKPAADGPCYKAIGNSMAGNVMRWIGERIQAVA